MFNKKVQNSIIKEEVINEENDIEESKTENFEIEKALAMQDGIANEKIIITEAQI